MASDEDEAAEENLGFRNILDKTRSLVSLPAEIANGPHAHTVVEMADDLRLKIAAACGVPVETVCVEIGLDVVDADVKRPVVGSRRLQSKLGRERRLRRRRRPERNHVPRSRGAIGSDDLNIAVVRRASYHKVPAS